MGKETMIFFLKLSVRLIIIVLSIILLAQILSDADLLKFSEFFSYQNLGWILVAATSLLGSVLIRSIRWQYLVYSKICKNERTHSFADFWNYLFSLVLNLLIPFRSGEIYRVLISGGSNKSIVKNSISAFTEKFFDILVVLGGLVFYLSISGTTFLEIEKLFIKKRTVLLISVGLAILLICILYINQYSFNKKLKMLGQNLMLNKNARFWIIIFLMTCLVWVLEAIKFFLVWYCLGNSMITTLPLLAFFLATLSLGIPGAPAALGTFHYAIIVATIPFGVEYAAALNYAVLMHLSYFLVLIFGSFFLYILTGPPTGFKEISISKIILKLKSGWTSWI
mgnify:CR=1 FL=1